MKTTIDVPPALWKDFTTLVIKREGTRKNNQVIIALLERYVHGKKMTIG